MRALLIGGTGYLGRSLCGALEQYGIELLVGANRSGKPDSDNRSTRMISASLDDTDALGTLLDVERPDVVVHLASKLLPASDITEYLQERARIINPTFGLLVHLAERSIPVVYISSGGAIYGSSCEERLSENSPRRPISYYGQAKLEIEEAIEFLGRTKSLSYLIVRPSNPFGGTQVFNGRQGLVAAILRCMHDLQPLRIWGDGSAIRDYIYIDDFSNAVSRLICQGERGIVNVGSGVGLSTLDVAQRVKQIVNRSLTIEFAPARAVDVPRIVLDTTRAVELGLQPARSFDEGVRLFASKLGLL